MPRILVSPVDYAISNADYGKSYNILNNLRGEDVTVDAYVSDLETPLESPGVTVHELHRANRLTYYADAFRSAARELRAGNVDVYHHMNLSYRWFNPLLLAGVQGETPSVLGPCQSGHAIMAHEFNRIASHAFGTELPRSVTDAAYAVTEAVRDVVLDPPRMELFERTLQAADRIVVVHEDAKAVYADLVDESKLRTIPLGVDPDVFEYSEPPDTQELVAIGSLRRRKGYDVLFDALATVTTDFPDVHLHVFGDGPLETDLRTQVSDLGLADNVTFHGFVDQSVVRDHLSRARAFVHPSRSESFSLVRLEAMSVGTPVVVSDTSGATEMVRDGREGFVVPREASKPLADAILEILADYELTRELGRAARERVERKYDWRTIGEQYVDVYRSLAD